MKMTDWKTTAELLGMAAIVASLILVAYEVRQAYQAAEIDSSVTRAAWIIDNRNAINDHPEIWLKGNSGIQLSDNEQLIYSNLIRNFHTNNGFTWRRDQALGVRGADFAADELAWFLYKYPTARREWESYMRDLSERRKALGRDSTSVGFSATVRATLEVLDAKD